MSLSYNLVSSAEKLTLLTNKYVRFEGDIVKEGYPSGLEIEANWRLADSKVSAVDTLFRSSTVELAKKFFALDFSGHILQGPYGAGMTL
jgi:hypothetical protein